MFYINLLYGLPYLLFCYEVSITEPHSLFYRIVPEKLPDNWAMCGKSNIVLFVFLLYYETALFSRF
jgi:hypothetical protein